MAHNTYPEHSVTAIIYGFRRSSEVEKAVAKGIIKILQDVVAPDASVHVHKYAQNVEDVAHGGVIYRDGGRKGSIALG